MTFKNEVNVNLAFFRRSWLIDVTQPIQSIINILRKNETTDNLFFK